MSVHFNEPEPRYSPVIPSRREESPGEAARAEREETRSQMTRSLANELALRAAMLRKLSMTSLGGAGPLKCALDGKQSPPAIC
jgi:hypothetical protein